jgi:hypothetical protein
MARTREVVVKPRNDAYTGLLAISFLALLAACVLMAMDANSLGDPPAKLNIDVPGVTAGKAVGGLQRPDAPKGDVNPVPDPKKDMGMREPARLPLLDVPPVLIPVKAEEPADPTAPPLPVQPFVPPM